MTITNKPKVLFIGELNRDLPQFKRFESKYNCIFTTLSPDRSQFINDLKTKYSDIVAIYAAWLGFIPIGGFRTVIDHAPSSLKIIAFCSVGYDHEDAEVMRERGIVMTNVPSDGAAEPVADLVLYNTITSFRQFNLYSKNFKEHPHTIDLRYQLNQEGLDQESGSVSRVSGSGYDFGHYLNKRPNLSPRGHIVAIVGFGKIGQTIGKRLHDIGMKINYVKRSKLLPHQELGLGFPVTYHEKITDVKNVDLIVIACPATPETHHLINASVINGIENPFRIINIGRGTVIDEQALVDGLKEGKVLFAGLDVFENEPKVHPDLINREDVVLTPHIGASTVENFDYTAIKALEQISEIVETGDCNNKVN
ncbi:hypothetical protein SBY92_002138 [Candida maltosa Xu316]|uniref:Glyoxylate reductase n=1 Tax=Candida maltosa (strain Xu316) TaxID=1245528 RepID=M3J4M5_CANMX|nr:hypothetical protein G210_2760 [Candida maltosa Xu316]